MFAALLRVKLLKLMSSAVLRLLANLEVRAGSTRKLRLDSPRFQALSLR